MTTSTDNRLRWKNRRRIVIATVAFCMAIIGYITIWGEDTALHRDIAQSAFFLMGSVVMFYIGGRSYEYVQGAETKTRVAQTQNGKPDKKTLGTKIDMSELNEADPVDESD